MNRAAWVLIGLAALAVAEIALIAWVAAGLGVLPTIGILVGIAVVGAWVAKREGRKAWQALGEAQQDPDPTSVASKLSDASLVLVGGLLLVLPGFITDVIGVLFLVPITRRAAGRVLAAALRPWARTVEAQATIIDIRMRPDTVIRGETVDDAPDTRPPRPDDPGVIRGEIEP